VTDDTRAWIVLGVVGSMALGVVLVPLRAVTPASNLAFAFLAFTIVVAEFGGRVPALVTAVLSAMSLNFFLTQPYLTLAISKPDDIVAFLALAVCGLIAAAFGRRRERWSELASRAGSELDVVRRLVEHVRAGTPIGDLLDELRRSFGLQAIALRDHEQHVIATAPVGVNVASFPETELDRDTLLPAEQLSPLIFGTRGVRLPAGGGRLRLRGPSGPVWLDVWEGDVRGFGPYETRALTIAASMLEFGLSRRQSG
jgi:K+-sensing histidine kinase KdpD